MKQSPQPEDLTPDPPENVPQSISDLNPLDLGEVKQPLSNDDDLLSEMLEPAWMTDIRRATKKIEAQRASLSQKGGEGVRSRPARKPTTD